MGPKAFGALELAFAGILLIVVLYIGGIFNKGESPIPPGPTPAPSPNTPPPQVNPTPTTVPQSDAVNTPVETPTPWPTLKSIIREPTPPEGYQIAAGDTCIGLAVRFNVSLESLIAANDLDAECRIIAGAFLIIPSQTAAP
jgi:LysM repeat protein